MGKPRHQAAHADASRNKVTKWQERPNLLYLQLGELGFKFFTISYEYDPGNRTIGAGKRPGGREGPILRLRKERLVVEILEDKAGPSCDPRFDHEDFPSRAKAPGTFQKKFTDVWQVVKYIGKYDCPKGAIGKWKFLGINHELRRRTREHFRGDQILDITVAIAGAGTQF